MGSWKFDADPADPLTELRIPVTGVRPEWGYFASFDKESEQRPTAAEAELIVSFIEEARRSWPVEAAGLGDEPFDWYPGYNTVVLHKYGHNDWGYRRNVRRNPADLFPPHPDDRYAGTEPMTLLDVFDRVHTAPRTGRIYDDWVDWKAKHPEIF